MAKARVKDIDRGYKKIIANLSKLSAKPYVKVGILEKAGKHEGADLTVAEIMSIHEFGAPSVGIPERAPLRKTVDQKRNEINTTIDKLYGKILDGDMDVDKALPLLGMDVKRKIQQTIREGLTPPWAESTLRARASKSGGIVAIVPLIDSGQTIRSIDYEVKIATAAGDSTFGKGEVGTE